MKKTKGSQDSRFVLLKKKKKKSTKQNPPCFSSLLIWDLCPPVPPVPSLLTGYQSLFSRHTIHLVYKESILHVQLRWSNSQRLWSAANMQKYKTQEDWISFHLRRVSKGALFSEGADHFHSAIRSRHLWQDISGLKPKQRLLILWGF